MPRNAAIRFDIDGLVPDRVIGLELVQTLGIPPYLDVEMVVDTPTSIQAWIGHNARCEIAFADETPQVFIGIVEEATSIGTAANTGADSIYVIRVVPRLALLARSVDSRIFQELDVKEIITKVLEDHAITEMDWRLSGSYLKREYCVQYQESALAFVTRLCEQEGIHFFVEAVDDKDTVVFSDDSTVAKKIEGDAVLQVRARTALDLPGSFALVPTDEMRVRTGKFTLRDYNFEKPKLDLTASAEAETDSELEIYDYPGEYLAPAEGKRLAQVLLECEQSGKHTLSLRAVCPRISAGRLIELTDATDLDGEYFVVEARHVFVERGNERHDLFVDTTLIPKDTTYRLPRRTPRPIIHGPQTARVVAPAGSELEAIHTDEHGRCKVKFHWDRTAVNDDKASCWMRVSQLQTSGSLVLPRIGWEVIIEYLEGNPDRPVIAGRLYEGVNMPPYALPEGKTRTSLQTRSTPGGGGNNEIRLEDKAGSEEIMIHAQKDMTIATANNKTKKVGNNETLVIGSNSSLKVGADQKVKITKGTQSTVSGDQSVTVGGNRKVEVNAVTGLTVHGSATTSVGGNQFEMDGNPLEALLALAAREAQAFLEAKAGEAIAAVQSHVQGAVDQALGPINDLTSRAEALGNNMQAVRDGDMSAVGGLVGDASGIPGAGEFARSLGGGQGGGGSPAGGNMITSAANNAVSGGATVASNAASQAIGGGGGAAHSALASALGLDAGGGGGSSMANTAGPAGDVGGVEGTDRAKGPGHTTALVTGSQSETVGGLKILGVLDGINTNVGGSMTQNAGAAHVEIVIGNRAEAAEGSKTETALGLVVLSKAGESENVGGSKTCMVGGAVIDKLKGSHAIEAQGPATFIGAFHKMEAKGKITLKCGASEVVIDGGGVTITSPMITVMGAKIQLPKDVSEV
ncbi:MAG TPA: type VI secretion system tip protein TssI/VgrG [Polyangiaceae bacterium]|nr:type VI secretion system tip protein TssI/VgrG [Polyangiaceae bacterium]